MILSTDGQTDNLKALYPPFNFVEARDNNLRFIKSLKIQNGCQSWLLITATQIVSCDNINHFDTISHKHNKTHTL